MKNTSRHASSALRQVEAFITSVGLNQKVTINGDVSDEAHPIFVCEVSGVKWLFRFEGNSELLLFCGDDDIEDAVSAYEIDWLLSRDPETAIHDSAKAGIGAGPLQDQAEIVRRTFAYLPTLFSVERMAETRKKSEGYRRKYLEEYGKLHRSPKV